MHTSGELFLSAASLNSRGTKMAAVRAYIYIYMQQNEKPGLVTISVAGGESSKFRELRRPRVVQNYAPPVLQERKNLSQNLFSTLRKRLMAHIPQLPAGKKEHRITLFTCVYTLFTKLASYRCDGQLSSSRYVISAMVNKRWMFVFVFVYTYTRLKKLFPCVALKWIRQRSIRARERKHTGFYEIASVKSTTHSPARPVRYFYRFRTVSHRS